MSVAQGRLMIGDSRRLSVVLVDLGVNPGRGQSAVGEPQPSVLTAQRVVIDIQPNGDFTVYSD